MKAPLAGDGGNTYNLRTFFCTIPMSFYSRSIILSALFLFTACGTSLSIPPSSTPLPNEAFGVSQDFIAGIEQKDVGQVSQLFVAKKGRDFVFLRKDPTIKTLCISQNTTTSCTTSSGSLLGKDLEKALRVSSQSVERILRKEHTLKDSELSELSGKLHFTTSNPDKNIPALGKYFRNLEDTEVNQCIKSTKGQEREILCYWKNIMPYYQYTDTTALQVSLSRALFSYKELTWSNDDFANLIKDFEKEVQS